MSGQSLAGKNRRVNARQITRDRNNTDFTMQILEYFKNIKHGAPYSFLKYYQNMTRAYARVDTGAKGVLIYHEMGLGKSLLAVAIAMDLLGETKIIMLVSKSLQQNMRATIHKYVKLRAAEDPEWVIGKMLPGDLDRWIDRNFSFVSMNAGNMLEQLNRAAGMEEFDAIFEEKMGKLAQQSSLNDCCLIVDEAHNLFRAITNGSKNAIGVYELVRKSPRCKFFPMTGTPIANDPFELVPCFNMLNGGDFDLLPTNYSDFRDLYVGRQTVKNRAALQNRLMGLVSYVGITSTPGAGLGESSATGNLVNMPEEYPLDVVRVPLTGDQRQAYLLARDLETGEGKSQSGPGFRGRIQDEFQPRSEPLQKPKSHASSTYRVKSRMLSNFAAPPEIKDPISAPTVDSPKFTAIYQNIEQRRGQLGLVYSQFTNIGGLAAFAEFLRRKGWAEVTVMDGRIVPVPPRATSGIAGVVPNDTKQRTFAIVSGEIDVSVREAIMVEFNREENKHGGIIDLLLVSSTGAEGLDLKRLRHTHIMEPYWNYGRIQQINSRAVRNDSHVDLPPDEQNVQPFIYIAYIPESRGPSTDEELFQDSIDDQILLEEFLRMLREVSIECAANAGKNCRVCQPTNRQLFTNDPWRDVRSIEKGNDPCTPVEEVKVVAQKITVDGTDYYYSEDDASPLGLNVYTYDENVAAYRPLDQSTELFNRIFKMITD